MGYEKRTGSTEKMNWINEYAEMEAQISKKKWKIIKYQEAISKLRLEIEILEKERVLSNLKTKPNEVVQF